MKSKNYLMMTITLGLLLALSVSGCIGNFGSAKPEQPVPATEVPEKTKKTTAIYHDFEDVLVPNELKVMKDRTVILSSPGFRSGILALRGMVDSTSLFNFFSNNMQKDNWNVVSKIKSPGITIMVYQKPTRSAVITIRDSQIYTYVEIGVAPTINHGGTGMTETELIE